MKSTIFEPAREIPVAGHFDVIVAGGGFAGISAALSAKRAGAERVLLIEREFTLGGLATLGLVTIYLPLCDGNGRQVSFGIAEELLRLSISRGAEEPLPAGWLPGGTTEQRKEKRFRCRFNAALFAGFAEKLLLDSGVEILYGTCVCGAAMQDGRLHALICENKNGRSAYVARGFVDATGDADVCHFCGEKTELFHQGNVLASWYYTCEDAALTLHPLGFCDIPDSEKPGGKTPESDTRERFSGLEANDLSRQMVLSRQWAIQEYLKGGDFTNERALTILPTIPQVRMTRRMDNVANMRLSTDGAHIVDSVGMISNWKRVGPVYEVPFGSLCAALPNLYAAGRCMAAEEDMWDVTRVIPCCAVTGEAAGVAAVVGRDLEKVQSILRKRKIPLHISELESN